MPHGGADDVESSPAAEAGELWDAVVIGAGLAGVYMLYRLRNAGFKVRAIEAGWGVGSRRCRRGSSGRRGST